MKTTLNIARHIYVYIDKIKDQTFRITQNVCNENGLVGWLVKYTTLFTS